MTPKRPLTLASLIATVSLTALTVTGSVHAQVPPRPAPPAAAAPAPPTRAAIQQRMAERRAARTADLATILRITPAQRPALDAFVAGQTPPRRDPANRMADAQARRNMTPQQRLDAQAKRVTERQAFATKRAESLRTFTAALNPEQRQVFDALNRLRGPDGRGRGGDRFGGPGRRGGGMGMRGPDGRDGRGDRGGRGGPGAPPPPAR
jgi:hypothetical protein